MYKKAIKYFLSKISDFLAPKLNLFPFWDIVVIKNCKITRTNNNLFGRLVNHFFWKEYYTRDIEKRKSIQEKLMGGQSGLEWAKYYKKDRNNFPPKDDENKLGILNYNQAFQGLNMICELIRNNNPEEFTCIQLGGSSGKEISYLAKKFPDTYFIYSDLFESVTSYASKKQKLNNLDYVTCPAESLPAIVQTCKNKRVIIFSIGSCQYVFPENLDLTFRLLSKVNNKEIDFILDESGNNSDDIMNYKGSLPRGLFSYSHNYKYFAEKYGFATKRWDFVEPFVPKEKFPKYLQNTIKLFGWFNYKKND